MSYWGSVPMANSGNMRPALKAGDIVKLSKKGKSYKRNFPHDSTLVVSSVVGDGRERSSLITCRIEIEGKFEHITFYRSELWFTGSNAFVNAVVGSIALTGLDE